MSNEQLTRLPPPSIDWQTRAEEAERLVAELKSGLAHGKTEGEALVTALEAAP